MPGGVGSTRMLPGGVGSTRMLPLKHLTTRHAGRGGVDMLPLKHLTTRHAGRGGVDKDVASQTPNNKTCRVGWGRQGCCLSNTIVNGEETRTEASKETRTEAR